MVVSGTGSVSLYTVQGTDTVPFVLHTVLVHAPVPYTSTGLVTGSGTAGTDTLCNGSKNGIKRYRFSTVSVLLLCRVSIAFALGQYRFCAGSVSLLYWVNVVLYTITVSFTYCFCTSLHKLMSCMHTWHLHCRLVQKRLVSDVYCFKIIEQVNFIWNHCAMVIWPK